MFLDHESPKNGISKIPRSILDEVNQLFSRFHTIRFEIHRSPVIPWAMMEILGYT